MILKTEHITDSREYWGKVLALAKEAFPPKEYLCPSKLAEMAKADNFDFLALIDGEEFVGFMMVQTHKTISYLFFLAILPECRSRGYGSRALETLRELYPERKQVVDFEMLDTSSENSEQRKKRKAFYLRNGYKETGLFLSYKDVDYEVLTMADNFDYDEFKDMMSSIPLENFHPRYFTANLDV